MVKRASSYPYIIWVVFTCVPGLCFEIRKAFDKDSKITEQNAISAYISSEYLVLDDLGVEKPTEWVKKDAQLYHLRTDNMFKPTIITSNLSLMISPLTLTDARHPVSPA